MRAPWSTAPGPCQPGERPPPLIRLENVCVRQTARHAGSSLKHTLLRRDAPPPPPVRPILEDIALVAEAGDHIGVLGLNGAGKTSLLKTIAGIYPTYAGSRHVVGSIAPVISQGIGFDHEISVRANIKLSLVLSARLTDFSKELEARILEFAELADRAEEPLKYLSTGLRGRLSFAISLFQKPEILLLDEVFAAGDFGFVEKAVEAMTGVFVTAPISLLASHDENPIRTTCNRCILLVDGRLVADGSPDEVLAEYHRSVHG